MVGSGAEGDVLLALATNSAVAPSVRSIQYLTAVPVPCNSISAPGEEVPMPNLPLTVRISLSNSP